MAKTYTGVFGIGTFSGSVLTFFLMALWGFLSQKNEDGTRKYKTSIAILYALVAGILMGVGAALLWQLIVLVIHIFNEMNKSK